ncbi:hypothetical protein BDW22DRAFT_709967 [Trametopsis cervina]|nr:hypothetical protein BDW22DRAFT_709967 [Trametopsis cervina]
MARTIRPSLLLSILCIVFAVAGTADASPILATLTRRGPVIEYDTAGHIANVTDPSTGASIAQGSGTDGGGLDFNIPAIIWLVWSFVIGAPLMLAGIRFWRITTGAGVGLAALVCIWAAFINAEGSSGLPDLLIMILALGAFLLGFFLGLFRVGRVAGMAFLAIFGGMSIGVRIVLFRPNLLIPNFAANWGVITVLGVISFATLLLRQRVAITVCSASVGTFLTGLGVDLIINKQSGMSFGLRYLFDRNSSHTEYLFSRGWHPPLSTEIIMGASLGLIPILALAQHHIFKQPFFTGSKDYIISSQFSESENREGGDRDDETIGGTTSLLEKKADVSEHSLSLTDTTHRPTPATTPTISINDHIMPESPTTATQETTSLVGFAT